VYDRPTGSSQQMTPAPTGDSLFNIVTRLNTYLMAETKSISENVKFDFRQSGERKSRLLFELNRASRATDPRKLDAKCRAELGKLKLLLARNEEKIKVHLSAVREVSELMVKVIRKEEADGTYGEYA